MERVGILQLTEERGSVTDKRVLNGLWEHRPTARANGDGVHEPLCRFLVSSTLEALTDHFERLEVLVEDRFHLRVAGN